MWRQYIMNRVVLFLVMLFAATPLLAAGDQLTKPPISSSQLARDKEFFEKYAWFILVWNDGPPNHGSLWHYQPFEMWNRETLEFWRGYVREHPRVEEITNTYGLHQLDLNREPSLYTKVSDSTLNKALSTLAEEAARTHNVSSGVMRYNRHDYFWYFTSTSRKMVLDDVQTINDITVMRISDIGEDYPAFPEEGFYALLLPELSNQVLSIAFSSGGDTWQKCIEVKDQRATRVLFSDCPKWP